MGSPITQSAKAPQVVIAYLDGRRVRGYVFDFSPMRATCKVFPSPAAQAQEGELVELRNLKAIFFLQDASGDGGEQPVRTSVNARRQLEVFFRDGEHLQGTTEGYSKERLGFFMVPEDPTGKILRVFVINANVKEVKWVQAARPAPST